MDRHKDIFTIGKTHIFRLFNRVTGKASNGRQRNRKRLRV